MKLTLHFLHAFYWTKALPPAPNSVVYMAHAHPTPNLELKSVVVDDPWLICIPHLGENICEANRTIVIHDADPTDCRNGPVEEKFAVVEVDVSTEATFQQLHQSKCCRDNHLQNVVGGVADKFPWRSFQVQHPS